MTPDVRVFHTSYKALAGAPTILTLTTVGTDTTGYRLSPKTASPYPRSGAN